MPECLLATLNCRLHRHVLRRGLADDTDRVYDVAEEVHPVWAACGSHSRDAFRRYVADDPTAVPRGMEEAEVAEYVRRTRFARAMRGSQPK